MRAFRTAAAVLDRLGPAEVAERPTAGTLSEGCARAAACGVPAGSVVITTSIPASRQMILRHPVPGSVWEDPEGSR
jgi:hypothetical protein